MQPIYMYFTTDKQQNVTGRKLVGLQTPEHTFEERKNESG